MQLRWDTWSRNNKAPSQPPTGQYEAYHCISHSRRNLLTNTRARQRQNTLGLHVSKESRRLCSKRPSRKVTNNVQQRHAIHLCFYIYNQNYIKGIALKIRKKEEIQRAYQEVYMFYKNRGFKSKLHNMDNETSKDVEDFIASQNTQQQYTPPE